MAGKVTEWPSNRGPISKIRPSDGCGRDTILLAVERWYDFHGFGCHLGNVGLSRRFTCTTNTSFMDICRRRTSPSIALIGAMTTAPTGMRPTSLARTRDTVGWVSDSNGMRRARSTYLLTRGTNSNGLTLPDSVPFNEGGYLFNAAHPHPSWSIDAGQQETTE